MLNDQNDLLKLIFTYRFKANHTLSGGTYPDDLSDPDSPPFFCGTVLFDSLLEFLSEILDSAPSANCFSIN